jgi:hypothetical protein
MSTSEARSMPPLMPPETTPMVSAMKSRCQTTGSKPVET